MRCEVFDPIGALDGRSRASLLHAAECPTCREGMERLDRLIVALSVAYRARLEKEALEIEVPDGGRSPLPPEARRRVAGLRRKRLVESLRERFGMSLKAARDMVARVLPADGLVPAAVPAAQRSLLAEASKTSKRRARKSRTPKAAAAVDDKPGPKKPPAGRRRQGGRE